MYINFFIIAQLKYRECYCKSLFPVIFYNYYLVYFGFITPIMIGTMKSPDRSIIFKCSLSWRRTHNILNLSHEISKVYQKNVGWCFGQH